MPDAIPGTRDVSLEHDRMGAYPHWVDSLVPGRVKSS